MAGSMTRQENHFAAPDLSNGERAGRRAIRGAHHLLPGRLEFGELGEAAAADDP